MPTDSRHNRLAVAVDDHDLEHAQYADDNKRIVDRGWWELIDRTDRRFVFELHGERNTACYALIRTGSDWLLHLTKEQPERPCSQALGGER
ncbi:hypothetical protein SAMN02799620_02638 [Mycolicibacterium fluoranthenivorans]|uniref:Uncharacterized protein n=2 Tax=Mycolicibacterium fluoranthenivorans TaxID=258505 RepID=A0A1G4W9Y5_9MYCO|nr:hypothetical protein SAMN02799620_02638 [Mycolicibacterium fluoranthenivorans]